MGRLQATLEHEAEEEGLASDGRVFGRVRDGLSKSADEGHRFPASIAADRQGLESALLSTVALFGSRMFTVGPNGEGVSDWAVRDAHGGKRKDSRRESTNVEPPEVAAATAFAALVDGADLRERLIQQLDEIDRLILDRYLAGEPNVAIARVVGLTAQRVGQRLAGILALGKQLAEG